MKKIKLNSKLIFKKEAIANLNKDSLNNVNGGGGFTGGCSDGDLCRTHWNCTKTNCTADCGTLNACQSGQPGHTVWTCTL